MNIKRMTIRGFKSFGNNEQTLILDTDKGGLILLYGDNGNGKSSLINSFEYTIYGKVRGRKKKNATLSTLPNRLNGTLQNTIVFDNSQGVEVEVTRGIGPNILTLSENGIPYDKHGKSSLDSRIIEHVGIDMETFNSFISMSINDFKNFTALSNDEKQLLLDKMFNLEIINQMNDILKGLVKINKQELIRYDAELNTLKQSIISITNSIRKTLEKEKENHDNEISEIKLAMESKREEYTKLKEKISKIEEKINEIQTTFVKERDVYNTLGYELKTVIKDIELYDQGKCPTCSTEFIGNHFEEVRALLNERRDIITSSIEAQKKIIGEFQAKKQKFETLLVETKSNYDTLNYFLRSSKNKIEDLTKKMSNVTSDESDNEAIAEFNNSKKEFEGKLELVTDKQTHSKDKEVYYKELSKIFGENGVKKTIIANIVRPLNMYIEENIRYMGLRFDVKIDDTFTADIKDLGESIDHDSLSTGENKKINICIMIAYLKMIRAKRAINVLFLDEVFSSIDVSGIEEILELLRVFALEYKINIFVVHHAIMNKDVFDRIIELRKNVFSEIVELNKEELNENK